MARTGHYGAAPGEFQPAKAVRAAPRYAAQTAGVGTPGKQHAMGRGDRVQACNLTHHATDA